MLEHLSVSQLVLFCRCGEQYRRRYIEGEIVPPGIAARIGSGVHKAAEVNWREKIRTGYDLPLDAVQDVAAQSYDKSLEEGVFFAPEEAPRAAAALAEGKDAAVALAALWHRDLAPHIRPALVEEEILLNLPGVPLPVVTILDLYTEDGALRDLKTAARKWPEDKAHGSNQPTAYREAVKMATGAYPEKIYFDVLVNGKAPALQTLETSRDAEDTAILAKKFQLMCRALDAGIFQPAQPDAWCCSPRFCGYYYTCPHIPAHRKILPKKSA